MESRMSIKFITPPSGMTVGSGKPGRSVFAFLEHPDLEGGVGNFSKALRLAGQFERFASLERAVSYLAAGSDD
jgi:hypothetical protein